MAEHTQKLEITQNMSLQKANTNTKVNDKGLAPPKEILNGILHIYESVEPSDIQNSRKHDLAKSLAHKTNTSHSKPQKCKHEFQIETWGHTKP